MLKFKKQAFHIFISTMAVASDWVVALNKQYGSQVEDLLQGTGLQDSGEKLGFGIHVVHGAISQPQAAEFMGELDQGIAHTALNSVNHTRGVEVKGSRSGTKRRYQTIQGTTRGCTCKYDYGAVARHRVYPVAQVPALKSFNDWVNRHNVSPMYYMNEVLANLYSREEDENIDWHNDMDKLYQTSTDVVSLSVGSPGVFCFEPRKNDEDGRLYEMTGPKSWGKDDRRQQTIDKGLRGLVPLFAGDLLVMSGKCQYYMQHKTLKFSRFTDITKFDKLLADYPATSEKSKQLLPDVAIIPEEISLKNRGNFTGRIISNHKTTPVRCPGAPEVPATLQLSHASHVPPTLDTYLPVDADSSDMRLRWVRGYVLELPGSSALPTCLLRNPLRTEPTVSPALLTDNEVSGLMDGVVHVDVHNAGTAHVSDVEVHVKCWMESNGTLNGTLESNLESIYAATPPEKHTKLSRLIEALQQQSLVMRQSRAITSISIEADDDLHELKTFEGVTCSLNHLDDHLSPTHESWAKGLMGTKKNRALRCLMPLSLALEIIKSADRERFMVDAVIEVDIGRLPHENQTVYWLKEQKWITSSFAGLFGSRIITKTIEFSLNFNEQMHRIQLSPTGRNKERCDRYIKALNAALASEKLRQMQIKDARPLLPWEVEDVWTMPAVLWIHKRQDQ